MAYPTVSAPYGLRPINLIGGQVFAGSTRMFSIEANYGTNIFYGDAVKISDTGYLVKETGTATTSEIRGVVGVFLGCTYTNPTTKQKLFSQYYPASTNASDIQAYVCDDPDALFKVALVAGSASSTIDPTAGPLVGLNVGLSQVAGSTTNGDSKVGADATSIAATATLPLRIVGTIDETVNSSGEFTEVIVKWNAPHVTTVFDDPDYVSTVTGGHMYNNPNGWSV